MVCNHYVIKLSNQPFADKVFYRQYLYCGRRRLFKLFTFANIKLLTCRYLKKCFCGTIYFVFSSSNDIRLLSSYKSSSLTIPLLNHVWKPMSFLPWLKSSMPQIGEKQDNIGESPIYLCASCQTNILFFTKGFIVFFLRFLEGAENRKISSIKPFEDNNSTRNHGKSTPLENQNIVALNCAAQ